MRSPRNVESRKKTTGTALAVVLLAVDYRGEGVIAGYDLNEDESNLKLTSVATHSSRSFWTNKEPLAGPPRISKATCRQISDVELSGMAEAAVVNRRFSPYSPGAQSYLGQASRKDIRRWSFPASRRSMRLVIRRPRPRHRRLRRSE